MDGQMKLLIRHESHDARRRNRRDADDKRRAASARERWMAEMNEPKINLINPANLL